MDSDGKKSEIETIVVKNPDRGSFTESKLLAKFVTANLLHKKNAAQSKRAGKKYTKI